MDDTGVIEAGREETVPSGEAGSDLFEYGATAPVEKIPTDAPGDNPLDGIALCLSGGGYRAMLFHLGAAWRLNDAGYLPRLNRVSSVSGGSITAGMLGLAWRKLDFDDKGVGRAFEREVVGPIRQLASKTIDVWAVLLGLLGPGMASDYVARAYERHLYRGHTLQDLPGDGEGPRFVINATNLQSGKLWRFSKPYAWDYRVGKIENPKIKLAVAVAASSAFPPVLSPMMLKFKESDYAPNSGTDLQRPPYTTRVYLTDGGVYDNLGLETAWKRYKTILVSDGGARMVPDEEPHRDYVRHALRVFTLTDSQVRSLRTKQVVSSYRLPKGTDGRREGAYWSTYLDIKGFRLKDALPCPVEQTTQLALTPTRLCNTDKTLQMRLINWGYAACDAALRARVDRKVPAPKGFPYPKAGVG